MRLVSILSMNLKNCYFCTLKVLAGLRAEDEELMGSHGDAILYPGFRALHCYFAFIWSNNNAFVTFFATKL